jgi:hypothetical protein
MNVELNRREALVLLRVVQISLDPKSPPLSAGEREIAEDKISKIVADLFVDSE